MSNKLPNNVLAFAAGNTDLYEKAQDWWNQYRSMNGAKGLDFSSKAPNAEGQLVEISFAEKEDQLNQALKREIMRVAGIANFDQFPVEAWVTHPTLKWATFAVVSAVLDVLMPNTLIDSIGLYSDVRSIGWGDSAAFDIEPRDLFVVSKAGRGKRMAEIHKQYRGQITIVPEMRELTVGVSLMRILAGKESLAAFVSKAVRSIETSITTGVYDTFAAAMASISATATSGLRVAGYTQSDFVNLSQKVAAYTNSKPIAIGTQQALSHILPLDANYRYDLESSEYVRLGYIRNFAGTDIMVLPQVADWASPFQLKLSDTTIWIIAPSADKLVKVVLEGSTLSHTDDTFANANLLQNTTLMKSWGQAIATNSIGATITGV
jgi:hypothetical protein